MELDGTMRVYLRQTPKRENGYENNEADTEVQSQAAICNLYPYDKVFNEKCDQEYIFECALKRTILYALDGYNVTTIAYGHSGTGKTHTIFGGADITKPEDAGMILKSVAYILEVIEEEQLEHTITVSYLDIYNEQIYDLLSPIDDYTDVTINEDMDEKDSVVIQDLIVVTIKNMPDLCRILKIGAENRVKLSLFENFLPSKLHSLFYVTIYTKEESVSGETILKRGNLIFVDTAASDYSTQSDQTNMQSPEDFNTIHQSLNTFNECITKLANKSPNIPFGESKLTRLLRDSLGGYTKTILLGTVNCSSLKDTGDFLYLAKRITTKPWVQHVFDIYNIIEKYKVKIEKLNSEIEHICLFPITDDTNFIMKEFEEKQATIINKVQTVKYLNKNKNKWLSIYTIFKNTKDDITDIGENKNFEGNADINKFGARCSETNFEITEQHFLDVNAQVEIINDLQNKLQKQEQVFCKNMNQSLDLIYSRMSQLIEHSNLLQRFLNSNRTDISENIKECDKQITHYRHYFKDSSKLIGKNLKHSEDILRVMCNFLDLSHIAKPINQFQETCREMMPSTIKYLTDQKEYVNAVTNNISSCICEITRSGQQYIETKRELYTNLQNTLTESMDFQKPHQRDFEEEYKNAVDSLKKMKSASDICFQKANERSKICETSLTVRHATLVEAGNMINSWHRQTVLKVNAFTQYIVKDCDTQKGKLANTKKLLEDTARLVMDNTKDYKTIVEGLESNMSKTLHNIQSISKSLSAKTGLNITLYFKDATMLLQKSALCTSTRYMLQATEFKKLIDSLNENTFKTLTLCKEKKTKFTYFINKLDFALEQCKLAEFESSNIIPSEIPPDTEENERLEEESSENTSVTLQPEPMSWKVKCNRPKYEGTLRERCKMRKTTSRRRREFEAEKARKESVKLQEEHMSLVPNNNDLLFLHREVVSNYKL